MPKKTQKRVFKKQTTIHHDLYQLEVADMIKDTSIGKTGNPDFLHPVKHQHFFHTVDSQGRNLFYSSAIGNHFHLMEITQGKDGEPPKVECKSGPLQWVRKKDKYGRMKRIAAPINDYDTHKHDVTYLQSEEITPRKANVEAAKVTAEIAAKESGQGKGSTEGLGAIIEG